MRRDGCTNPCPQDVRVRLSSLNFVQTNFRAPIPARHRLAARFPCDYFAARTQSINSKLTEHTQEKGVYGNYLFKLVFQLDANPDRLFEPLFVIV